MAEHKDRYFTTVKSFRCDDCGEVKFGIPKSTRMVDGKELKICIPCTALFQESNGK